MFVGQISLKMLDILVLKIIMVLLLIMFVISLFGSLLLSIIKKQTNRLAKTRNMVAYCEERIENLKFKHKKERKNGNA